MARWTSGALHMRAGEDRPFVRSIKPDRILGGAELAIYDVRLNTQGMQQPEHRAVAVVDQRGESSDALLQRSLAQLPQQHGAKATSLPVIDHRDRDLRGLAVVDGSDETGDAHTTTVHGTQRDDRLVIVMVDVGEVAQFCLG